MTTRIKISNMGGNHAVVVDKTFDGSVERTVLEEQESFEAYVYPGTEFTVREKE